jgi:hypothetical protein
VAGFKNLVLGGGSLKKSAYYLILLLNTGLSEDGGGVRWWLNNSHNLRVHFLVAELNLSIKMLAFKTHGSYLKSNLRKFKSIIRIRLSTRVIPTLHTHTSTKSDIAKSAHTKIINFLSPALSAAIIKGNNNKTCVPFPHSNRFDVREYIQKAAGMG